VTDVPVGETGELLVKGPQVMKGYWNRPDATAETITDGWLHTGDIAKMDEDGYFYIVDRKKDMIISGGFNVYPRDIEEVFFEHPKVMEATVIGIPHPKRGEAVKVFVVLKEGQTATTEELLKYCEDKLAKYKWPTEIEFRKELPKTNVGKVLKKDLRAMEQQKKKNLKRKKTGGRTMMQPPFFLSAISDGLLSAKRIFGNLNRSLAGAHDGIHLPHGDGKHRLSKILHAFHLPFVKGLIFFLGTLFQLGGRDNPSP
jgi:hypothetical protein